MRITRTLFSLLILSLLLSACLPSKAGWTDTQSEHWQDDAVFYEIFVRSYADANGDGIGDFAGLTARLDYLNDGKPETTTDLGVTGIWLMPIFPSPSYHGYDVTDYYAVNPEYGTLDEFKTLLAEAHKRGIKVIIDFVINHTSSQHPWFQASAAGDAQYRNFYIWSEKKPGFVGPWNQQVWHPLNGSYYYGVFTSEMPDLNYNNPAVTAEIEKVAAFWLNDVGVDGFRVDGAKHLIESGPAQENTSQTHQWFEAFNAYVEETKPEALVVGEIWSPAAQAARYVNDGELDLVFNFPLAEDMLNAAAFGNGRGISNKMDQQGRYFTTGRFAPFLTNHDQPRVMTRLKGDLNQAKAAAAFLLTAPGTPFLYYGEEIGMTGDKPDPNIRTPMQWSAETNAGFTSGAPWMSVNADYPAVNVAAQTGDETSLLSLYRDLIRVRSQHYALRTGAYVPASTSQIKVYAALRTTERESVLVLVNMANEPLQGVTVKWGESALRGTLQPTLLLGTGEPAAITVNEQGGLTETQILPELPANSTTIIQYLPQE